MAAIAVAGGHLKAPIVGITLLASHQARPITGQIIHLAWTPPTTADPSVS